MSAYNINNMNQTPEIQELNAQYEKLRIMYQVYEKEIQESNDEFEKNFMIEMREKVGEQMKAIVLKKIQIKVDNHMKKADEETITLTKTQLETLQEEAYREGKKTKEEDEESVSSEESEESEEAEDFFRTDIHKYTIMCFSKEKQITKFDFNFSRNFPFTQQEKGSTPKSFVYECIFQNKADFETAQDITLFNMSYKNKDRFKWFYFPAQPQEQPKEVITYLDISNDRLIPNSQISTYNDRYSTTTWYANKKIVINGKDCELKPIFPRWGRDGEPCGIPKFYVNLPEETEFQKVSVSQLQVGDIFKPASYQDWFCKVVKITACQIQYKILPKRELGVSGDYFGFYKNWSQYEDITPNPNQNTMKMNKTEKFRGVVSDSTVEKFIGEPRRMICYRSGDGGR